MFAPAHHPAMKHVVPVRKGLAVRTIFNFLGPLTNPAGARRQLIGVSDRRFLDIMAGALGELGCEHALLVASDDGLDELSTSGPTHIVELRGDGRLDSWTLTPEEVGLAVSPQSALAAGTPERNAEIAHAVLAGQAGPERDLTALNAGAAIYVGGLAETIEQGPARPSRPSTPARRVRCWRSSSSGRTHERPPGVPGRGHPRGAGPAPPADAPGRARGAWPPAARRTTARSPRRWRGRARR